MTRESGDRRLRGAGRAERLEALLGESGLDPAVEAGLVAALAELQEFGTGEPSAPRPELAALLQQSDRAGSAPVRRRSAARRARVVIVGVTVVACASGLGVAAAAAADQGFRHSVGHTFAVVVGAVSGTRHTRHHPGDGLRAGATGSAPSPEPVRVTARFVPSHVPDSPTPSAVTPHSWSPSVRDTTPAQPGIVRGQGTAPASPTLVRPMGPLPRATSHRNWTATVHPEASRRTTGEPTFTPGAGGTPPAAPRP